jgi:hypothetical protein
LGNLVNNLFLIFDAPKGSFRLLISISDDTHWLISCILAQETSAVLETLFSILLPSAIWRQ